MSYGQELTQLNPLPPSLVAEVLSRYCAADAEILDVGCGRGHMLRWLQEHTRYQTLGVEPDADYAQQSNALCGSAEKLPLADNSCDGLLLQCVFSLLDDPTAAAGEARRALRAGGVVLLTDLYARRSAAELRHSPLLRHIYAAAEIERFFLSAGFNAAEFSDHSPALTGMLAQMIWDGTACSCLSQEETALLRQVRAGYGLWVFTRQ